MIRSTLFSETDSISKQELKWFAIFALVILGPVVIFAMIGH